MSASDSLPRSRRPDRLALLLRGELGRAAHLYAAHFGTLAAFACARTDEIPLEFRQAAEHGWHEPPCEVVVSAHASASERGGLLARLRAAVRGK